MLKPTDYKQNVPRRPQVGGLKLTMHCPRLRVYHLQYSVKPFASQYSYCTTNTDLFTSSLTVTARAHFSVCVLRYREHKSAGQ